MSSGRASKRKGAGYENDVAKHFRAQGVNVTRAKQGNAEGDLLGIPGIVVELKNQKTFALAAWIDQTIAEVEHAGADYGVLIAKRPRRQAVAEHYFIMTVEDGLKLLKEAGRV